MPTVRFIRSADLVVVAEVEAESGDNLTDLARFHEVPMPWRCGQGTCGTCLVRLEHDGQLQPLAMRGIERNVLKRIHGIDAVEVDDSPQTPRLACHVTVGDVPLTVWLDPHSMA
ncbi:2Fe-2S iron-sulfur cluster binding domain-containing protein [Crenobacter sp. SG2303]|uniref:2Fe-2S iron-sulfur cluster binding domain-containing protein n=1 Tax=Crenobacter oryzisoli TaxID=3056844 RepID=A0ABT7XNM3_9NEIS|nr:2Fe-2S iron-sulfur cluster binding domain-containing protein [Crenobacter sp. SG2303]MDN0075389.1 2Fe-2S iron-sulfur cluster binding domain-containing protein [Crenobacter sp. SG2303]